MMVTDRLFRLQNQHISYRLGDLVTIALLLEEEDTLCYRSILHQPTDQGLLLIIIIIVLHIGE